MPETQVPNGTQTLPWWASLLKEILAGGAWVVMCFGFLVMLGVILGIIPSTYLETVVGKPVREDHSRIMESSVEQTKAMRELTQQLRELTQQIQQERAACRR